MGLVGLVEEAGLVELLCVGLLDDKGLTVAEIGFLVSGVLATVGFFVINVELGLLVVVEETGLVGLLVVEFLGGNLVAGILDVVDVSGGDFVVDSTGFVDAVIVSVVWVRFFFEGGLVISMMVGL